MSLQYLIDTDWVIHYLHAYPTIVARLDELQPQGLALSVYAITGVQTLLKWGRKLTVLTSQWERQSSRLSESPHPLGIEASGVW
jgi:hypothetical protein